MTSATIAIAVLLSLLAATRRNLGMSLGILVFSMLIWPEYLRFPVGIVQMSAPRLVAVFLLMKFIASGQLGKINLGKIDAYVLLIWLWTVLATFIADAATNQLTQMIGRGLDTVLIYFVARMAFRSSEDVKGFYGGLAASAVLMCIAGGYEAVTWKSPYHAFLPYSDAYDRTQGYEQIRLGLLRAQGSTQVTIFFGMAMMLVTGFLLALRGIYGGKLKYRFVLLSSSVAALSSLSSGPWMALLMLFFFHIYYYRPSFLRPTLYGVLALMVLIEVASNRHFYNIIDYVALDKTTSWYRTRLLEVAVSQLHEYWLFGVGSTWPHHWGQLVDGRRLIDVVNNFVIIALYGGLPALLLYLATHFLAVKAAILAYRTSSETMQKQMYFAMIATMIALDISSMSVGLYGPALLLSNILLGMMVTTASLKSNPIQPQLKENWAWGLK